MPCLLALIVAFFFTVTSQAKTFPGDFYWCAATAAHQIEGNNTHSDWWAFEQVPGNVAHGERSGMASNHWNMVEEDVSLMKGLGLSMYRFSVEWAKIEPVENQFSQAALDHYLREITLLREAGIEPMVTLQHFTLPKWLADEGGWASPRAAHLFARYAHRVYEALGEKVTYWVTINEPMVILLGGYLTGEVPPQKAGDMKGLKKALLGMMKGHAKVYRLYKGLAKNREIKIGMAKHLRIFRPYYRLGPLTRTVTGIFDKIFNWMIPEALMTGRVKGTIPFLFRVNEEIEGLAGSMDYFGLNYYSRDLVKVNLLHREKFELRVKKNAPTNDMGWEIYPHGLYLLLKRVAKKYPAIPIYITENGIADADDDQRAAFILSHLGAVGQAMSEGVPVKSYCHWSLLDNFEWHHGFSPRFGLFEVNYQTFERKLRESGKLYSQIIKSGALPPQK